MNPNRRSLYILFLLIFLTQFPYIYAAWQSNQSLVFGGFLFNPLDGNTYLSKMRQGWEGKWFFELTYSPERNQPAFLFVFYLLLGHLSRIFHLDLLVTYHLMRLLACIALFIALRNFFQWLFEDSKTVAIAFSWAVFGAGAGWLAFVFGVFAPDFWIAEGYVFLSVFANPHFPLAIALMVWMLTLSRKDLEYPQNLWAALFSGVILANLSPFAWLITAAVLGIYFLIYKWVERREEQSLFLRLLFFGLGGLPFLGYQFWVVRQDAVLAEWNRQNVTPSPHFGELLIGYLPLVIWATFGVIHGVRQKNLRYLLPLIWVAVSLLMVYFPSSLQRRFLIGLYVPFVALAMLAYQELSIRHNTHGSRNPQIWLKFTIALSMVTNLLILFATFQAINQHDRTLFLDREEVEAFRWLSQNLPKDTVVLASPESGAFIPAWSGLRVVYGHPFESIQADERKRLIEKFYKGEMSLQEQREFLADHSVAAILWGERERDISNAKVQMDAEQTYPIGYRSGQITIYRVIP